MAPDSVTRRVTGLTLLALVIAALALLLALGAGTASASKEAIAYFGGDTDTGSRGGEFRFPDDIAVNSTGAGPAGIGDIYVADNNNRRVQRFSQDDNGTPSDPYDDTYEFVAAWGVGVAGGSGYEICTVASQCQEGVNSGQGGGLSFFKGIAVDQDTGEVYASDTVNRRVSVYSGDGTFLRAFGYDVVES